MRSDIRLILDKAYELFNVAPPAMPLDVCAHCCIIVEQEQALRSMSVKDIPFDLISEYNDAAIAVYLSLQGIENFVIISALVLLFLTLRLCY